MQNTLKCQLLVMLVLHLIFSVDASACVACSEQKVRHQIRGIAYMAGQVNVTVTGSGQALTTTMTSPSGITAVLQDQTYSEAEWADCIQIDTPLDEAVTISFGFISTGDPTDTARFGPPIYPGPVSLRTYFRVPKGGCLQYWVDKQATGNWEKVNGSEGGWTSGGIVVGPQFRLKASLKTIHDDQPGESDGPQAGGNSPPAPNVEWLATPTINSLLGGSAAAQSGSSASPASAEAIPESETSSNQSSSSTSSTATGAGPLAITQSDMVDAAPNNQSFGPITEDGITGPGGESLAMSPLSSGSSYDSTVPIGRIRMDMSLGSYANTVPLGKIVYQNTGLGADALDPACLFLDGGIDYKELITDNGYPRQLLLWNGDLVDIVSGSNLEIHFYDSAHVGAKSGGVYTVTGSANTTWTISGGSGSLQFQKTGAGPTETHNASWSGTSGSSGTMDITYYSGERRMETTYSMNGSDRVETVSTYKGGTLHAKTRSTYHVYQYDDGIDVGELFEAKVEEIRDPDGKAYTSRWTYNDLPGLEGFIKSELSPDGNWKYYTYFAYPNPFTFPEGRYATSAPYLDAPATPAPTTSGRYQALLNPGNFPDDVTISPRINGAVVGDIYMDSGFSTSLLSPAITGDVFYFYEAESIESVSGDFTVTYREIDTTYFRSLYVVREDGASAVYFYTPGTWDGSAFTADSNGSFTEIKMVEGNDSNPGGIANESTATVMIENELGQIVQESVHVGTGGYGHGALISRTTHTYTSGRKTSSVNNGRMIWQGSYYADGNLEWEENEWGQRTTYTYDAFDQIETRTITGRGGQPDKAITYTYNANGQVLTESTVSGTLTRSRSYSYDLGGRMESETGEDGLTTLFNTDVSAGYPVVTRTLPSGGTVTTSMHKDGLTRSITGTGVNDRYFQHTVAGGFETVLTAHNSSYTLYPSVTIRNWVGDTRETREPLFKNASSYLSTLYSYNYKRQLTGLTTPGGERAARVFKYDPMGRLAARGYDLDGSGDLEPGSASDRFIEMKYTYSGSEEIVTTTQYLKDSDPTPTLTSVLRSTFESGLGGNQISEVVEERQGNTYSTTTVTLDTGSGTRTTTIALNEQGGTITRVEVDGLLKSEQRPEHTSAIHYGYTGLDELETINDPLTGLIAYGYNSTTRQLDYVEDALSRRTHFAYHPSGGPGAGRVSGEQDPNGSWTRYAYDLRGNVEKMWGANLYPVGYQYNEQDNITRMTTYRTKQGEINWTSGTWPGPGSGDTTEWVYDPASGLLEEKRYPATTGGQDVMAYTYDSALHIDTTVNGRGTTIDYTANTMGEITHITYDDGITPAVGMIYDRGGRIKQVTDASGTRTITWTDRNQIGDEAYTAGALSGMGIHRDYDGKFRIEYLKLSHNGTTLSYRETDYDDSLSTWQTIKAYQPDESTLISSHTYGYEPDSRLVSSIATSRQAGPVQTQTYGRDVLARIESASVSDASSTTLRSWTYQYHQNLDRRERTDREDGTHWAYGYNARNEVTGGSKKLSESEFMHGHSYAYEFDDIGNRISSGFGGDESGQNLHTLDYTPNAANQLEAITNDPGVRVITGEAPTTLTMKGLVNGTDEFTIERQGQRFAGEVSVDNTSGPAYPNLKLVGIDSTSGAVDDLIEGNTWINPQALTLQYDGDGNLTHDGRRIYTWDAENRLISMTPTPEAIAVGVPNKKLVFHYDNLNRRFKKEVQAWDGSAYVAESVRLFVYDRWNLLGELDSLLGVLRTYTWGLDISSTDQEAGGIAGLLVMHEPASGDVFFPYYDGSGNVMGLMEGDTGAVVAEYEYGPFGELLRVTGPAAPDNPIRYSSKYLDEESGLIHFGFRFYNPETGRWLNRDPIVEQGGANLYAFVANNPVLHYDPYGLFVDTATAVTFGRQVLTQGWSKGPLAGFVATGAVSGAGIWWAMGSPAVDWENGGIIYLAKDSDSNGGGAKPPIKPPAAPPCGDDDDGMEGNLRPINTNILKQSNMHTFKQEFVGNQGSRFNTKVDTNSGEVVLAPRISGTGPNIRTGISESNMPNFYPR